VLIFVLSIFAIPSNISYATKTEEIKGHSEYYGNEYLVMEETSADENLLYQENEDYVSPEVRSHLKKIESEIEKERRADFKKYKEKYSIRLKRKLLEFEEKKYNAILKILAKLIKPLERNKTCRGGNGRVSSAINLLNKLVIIHKTVETGSRDKEKRLNELSIQTQQEYNLFKHAPKRKFDFSLKKKILEPETKEFISNLKRRNIKAAGINLNGAYGGGLRFGVLAGRSKTPYGTKNLVVSGKGGIGFGLGLFLTGEFNSFNAKIIKNRSFENESTYGSGRGGVIFSGGAGFSENLDYSFEGGIGVGGMGGIDSIAGFELCPIPLKIDCKYFAKSVGLTPENGKLPIFLKNQLDKAKTREQVKQIDITEYILQNL
jgi:hypothetical protein